MCNQKSILPILKMLSLEWRQILFYSENVQIGETETKVCYPIFKVPSLGTIYA